jgi:hypothetical protein
MRKIITCILLLNLFLLSACTLPTRYEREPNGIGFGNDDYKKSKCACMQFNNKEGFLWVPFL